MSGIVPARAALPADRAAAVRAELDRILAGRVFRSSPRLCRFLEFIVRKRLEGRQSEIKEYSIGVEVCERGRDFDPRIDPIVRIDARRLRARLREYYDTEAPGAPLRISLATGSYVPEFDQHERTAPPAVAGPSPRSIAVLPLLNLGGGPDEEIACEGLTDGLITALARIPGIKVVARTSSFLFQGGGRDIREIGELLRVGGIVEGTVQHAAPLWRIAIRLVDTHDGCVLWSQVFDAAETLPFRLQDEIAAAVCRRLGLLEWPAPQVARPVADAAWALYAKARHQFLKWTPDAVARGIGLFEAAIDEAPDFAQAYGGLAAARCWHANYGVSRPRELFLSARFSAEKALSIDPATAEAWFALGNIYAAADWDWEAADRAFRRAVDLQFADAMAFYPLVLAFQGRLPEAEGMIDRAMVADPLSLMVRSHRALIAAFSGDDETAIRLSLELLDLEPRFARSHWALGIAYSRQKQFDLALEHYRLAREAIGDAPFLLGWQGHCLAVAGRRDDALAVEAELDRLAAVRFVPDLARGLVRLGLGDHERALDYFEGSVDERTLWALEFKVSGIFRPLRGNPRFTALLRQMRLE